MIVPMKKAVVMVQEKDSDSALRALRLAGVMHVEHAKTPGGEDIDALQNDIALIDSVLDILSAKEFSAAAGPDRGRYIHDWRTAARHVIDLYKRMDQLGQYRSGMARLIGEWERWGDFNPDRIRDLIKNGIYIKLYCLPKKEIAAIPEDFIVKKIFTSNGMVGCAVISRKEIDLPFIEVALPREGLNDMRVKLSENTRIAESIKMEIRKYAFLSGALPGIKRAFKNALEFREALDGMGRADRLAYLTGYIPFDAAAGLTDLAKKEKWAILIKDPSGDDKVPTLLRNPKWVSIISPVFKLIEVVPGYRELDTSLFFLVFLSVFFGMLIGDAGYGAIFFLLTLAFNIKLKARTKNRSVFALFYLLSSCAIMWGLLTGTFFGQEWLGGHFKPLLPVLRDDKKLQALCFLIGAFHLSIGHLWRAIIKLPSVAALADLGWVSILWSAFFLAKTLILGAAFPVFGKWFFIIGAFAILLFTNPNKNLLKCVGSGIGSLLLNAVNSFTDIVSYIRLFAVGLATVAIADAFNRMALDFGYGNFLAGVMSSVIILLGHGLNIVLGPLSVLVHGVRLNVLEFCSHADIKWSGFSYKPFR